MHVSFTSIDCPYCGESIEMALDPSAGDQDYIEDCQVCCRPIQVRLRVDFDGDASVSVSSGDETS